MPSFFSFFTRPSRLLLPVAALIVGFGTTASATAPKAPTNLKVITSMNVANNTSGTARYYLLRWQDNSLDETGFKVEARLGNTGAFLAVDTVGPNNQEYVLAFDFGKDVIAQFRVLAFKYNGSKIESSESNLVQHIAVQASGSLNAPTGFQVNLVNDGYLRFRWNDTSTNEIFYQIFHRKTVSSGTPNEFTPLGNLLWFNDTATDINLKHGLIPGQSYDFAVRATRRNNSTSPAPVNGSDSALTPVVVIPVPTLVAPTELSGEAYDQQQIILRWKDNSANETGYQIEYKAVTTDVDNPPEWTTFTTVSSNTTAYAISTGPGITLEWRVKAIYEATGVTKITTDPTNVHTISTVFPGPTGLTATTSGVSGAVDLTWQDIAETETNYDIYTRVTGTSTWYYCQSMLADTTRATVTTRVEEDEDENSTNVPLVPDTEYDFVVEARYSGTGAVSAQTNVAKAFARHGFTSRTYHPAKVGASFSYTMAVSNSSVRNAWSVTGLPAGLGFDEETGVISGTPETSGVFSCPMTVQYSSGPPATTPLMLRVLPEAAGPEVAHTIPAITVGTATKFIVPLADKFTDPDAEKAVKLRTSRGDVDIVLYPSLVPEAVNNFMGYVNNKAYNGVIFHRSVPTFIVQGGAYARQDEYNSFASLIKRPSPLNEPGISNVRGTIAAAKVGGNPDSATHDFFFNVEDNSLKPNIELDNQNGGFTVFARVAGSGMSVVDSIAALPIGVYKDYNSSGGTDSTLDRRVTLDGSKVAFEEVPMNVSGTTAPTNMDVTQTVQMERAYEIPVLSFEADNTDAAVVSATIVTGGLQLEGLKPGTSTVTVRARDLDGNPVEAPSFTVTVVKGHKAPAITKHPVAIAAVPGSKGSMTVTATGTALTYQWRKNQTPITGATAKTLSFTNIQAGDVGSYDVQVSNSTTTLTSTAARLDLRSIPDITGTLPQEVVVELGDPLVLETTAVGAPAPAFAWLKDGKTVAGQKLAKLNIPVTKLTDGGNYVLRASNVAGKEDSAPAAVIVVDKASRLMASKPNANIVLKAQVSGPGLSYQWRRDGVALEADTDVFIGTQTATLTIKGITIADSKDYVCRVWGPSDEPVDTGAWRVRVVQAPNLTTFTPDFAYVGLDYDYTLPGGGVDSTTVTSFTVTGLPAGLKLDAALGRITGKATKPGDYIIKVTAKNPAGSSAVVSPTLRVLPMPEAVVGTFVGMVRASTALNGGKGGRVDMTVTEGGLISGKITQGKDVLSFTGTMLQIPGSIQTSGTATVVRKGLAPLEISLAALAPSGYTDSGNVSGTISDGINSVVFTAYRNIYHSTWRPNSFYIGNFNLGLDVTGTAVGQESVPQGSGYVVATVDRGGVAKLTGRLADGTTVTASSFLGAQSQFLIHQSLYKNTGTLVGMAYLSPLDTTTNRCRVDGSVLWSRDAQTLASDRTYKAGFLGVPVSVLGMTYLPPSSTNRIVMALPNAAGNARLDFEDGGLDAAAIDPDVPTLQITNANDVSIVAGTATNPAKVKVSIAPGTGIFSGSFELSDPPAAPKRTSAFYGLIIPQIPTIAVDTFGTDNPETEIPGTGANGVGHFLLAQLPSEGTTLTTSKILSGSVRLNPASITISDQPDSTTVDPGTNVTFTVVAAAPGGALAYQWRKNGVSLSGAAAKTATYTINSVAESHEGKYDVVITTSYSRVVSQEATLELNKPVSNIVITRNPATNPIPVGGAVTFTATCKGSGPLTYRWRKNGTDINGDTATQSTYTISNVTLDDAATYSVRVTNPLTPGGVVSGGNSMTVANPITSVTAVRTPSSESVGVGAVVTFSVTDVAGSAGPYTYQWYRNDTAISGATSSVYTINFVNSDHAGVYTVKVKNNATPDGVESGDVPLAVSTGISNVQASRTPADDTVPIGTSVTFNVSTLGAGQISFQWKKNDVDIPNATNATYTINAVTVADAGNYTVRVSNATTPDGVLSGVVSLGVQQPITTVGITRTPDLSTFTTGDTVEFRANPNGTGPFVYHWYKDEVELPTATDSILLINGLTEFDSGNYRVQVSSESSPAGVSSSSVSITVVAP